MQITRTQGARIRRREAMRIIAAGAAVGLLAARRAIPSLPAVASRLCSDPRRLVDAHLCNSSDGRRLLVLDLAAIDRGALLAAARYLAGRAPYESVVVFTPGSPPLPRRLLPLSPSAELVFQVQNHDDRRAAIRDFKRAFFEYNDLLDVPSRPGVGTVAPFVIDDPAGPPRWNLAEARHLSAGARHLLIVLETGEDVGLNPIAAILDLFDRSIGIRSTSSFAVWATGAPGIVRGSVFAWS